MILLCLYLLFSFDTLYAKSINLLWTDLFSFGLLLLPHGHSPFEMGHPNGKFMYLYHLSLADGRCKKQWGWPQDLSLILLLIKRSFSFSLQVMTQDRLQQPLCTTRGLARRRPWDLSGPTEDQDGSAQYWLQLTEVNGFVELNTQASLD